MPKIPLYNEGRGQAVGLATGSLGPRASSAAFEAPSKALAQLGQQVSQIAFDFGQQEKKDQTRTASIEYENKLKEMSDEFLRNDLSTSTTEFDGKWNSFMVNFEDIVNQDTNLTNSQRKAVLDSVSTSALTYNLEGKQNSFNRMKQRKGEAFRESLANQSSVMSAHNVDSLQYKKASGVVQGIFQEARDLNIDLGVSEFEYGKGVDADRFVRGVEAASSIDQINKLEAEVDADESLTGAAKAARLDKIDARRTEVQAELAEAVFQGMVSDTDDVTYLQSEEGLDEVINKIRKGEEIVVTGDDGEIRRFNATDLDVVVREQIIAKLEGRFSSVESERNDDALVGINRRASKATNLAQLNTMLDNADNGTGIFAGKDLAFINAAKGLIENHKSDLTAKVTAQAKADTRDINASILANKGVVTPETQTLIDQTISNYRLAEEYEMADALAAGVKIEKVASSTFASIEFATPQFRRSVLDGIDTSTDVGLRTYQSINEKLAAANKAMTEDFVGYYLSSNKEELDGKRPTANQLITIQENMGIAQADIRVATNAEIAQFKDDFRNETNYAEKAKIGQQFLARYGQNGNIVMRQLRKSGAITLVDNLIMSYPSSVNMRQVEAYNQPDAVEDYKKLPKSTRDEVSEKVTASIGDFSSSIIGSFNGTAIGGGLTSGRDKHVRSMKDIVTNTALGYINGGIETDVDAAVEKAYNDVIGDHFEFETLNDQTIRFNKGEFRSTSDIKDVLGFTINSENEDYLRSIITPPPPPVGADAVQAATYEDEYFRDLTREGSWRTTTDNSAIFLVDQLGNMVAKSDGSGYIQIPMANVATMADEYRSFMDDPTQPKFGSNRTTISNMNRNFIEIVMKKAQLF